VDLRLTPWVYNKSFGDVHGIGYIVRVCSVFQKELADIWLATIKTCILE